jgi:hypothetical protein
MTSNLPKIYHRSTDDSLDNLPHATEEVRLGSQVYISADLGSVERISPLHLLATPAVSERLTVLQAKYRRPIPPHYQGNPYIREELVMNLIFVPGGSLVVPKAPRASFLTFFEELRKTNPALFEQILSPTGTAKAASTDLVTPIKQITQMDLAGESLPGDHQFYGWHELESESARMGLDLQLLFQGNGLYFNRGSVFYDGENLLAYPDTALAEILEQDPSLENRERLAVEEKSLKRPLLFFVAEDHGQMSPYLHQFYNHETYRHGMRRLLETFRKQQVRSALAASPPLVIPDADQNPVYLREAEVLSGFHANDIRHYLYCPYEGAVLLSAELGRAQSLRPAALADAMIDRRERRIRLRLVETLNFVTSSELGEILDRKGYAGRYALTCQNGVDYLDLNPLEGVYSHLVLFLTREGQFGLIQTSGTHGNITGNDGPTLRQLSAVLRDLNAQPPFDHDPILAAVSGCQGNDVPNIVCRGQVTGDPNLLYWLAPETVMDNNPVLRGTVTTPRVGIAV